MTDINPADRRRSPRFPVFLDATLQIMFPEDTFRPQPLPVTTTDLSMFGIRVSTQHTTPDFYKRVIRDIRYAKVELALPGSNEIISLHGRIAWVDFDNKTSPPSCTYGIMFERLSQKMNESLVRALETLAREQVAAGKSRAPAPPGVPLR